MFKSYLTNGHKIKKKTTRYDNIHSAYNYTFFLISISLNLCFKLKYIYSNIYWLYRKHKERVGQLPKKRGND